MTAQDKAVLNFTVDADGQGLTATAQNFSQAQAWVGLLGSKGIRAAAIEIKIDEGKGETISMVKIETGEAKALRAVLPELVDNTHEVQLPEELRAQRPGVDVKPGAIKPKRAQDRPAAVAASI